MATTWSLDFFGTIYPAWEALDAFTPLVIKGSLVLCGGRKPVPLSRDFNSCHSLSFSSQMYFRFAGECILTTAGEWWELEKHEHISTTGNESSPKGCHYVPEQDDCSRNHCIRQFFFSGIRQQTGRTISRSVCQLPQEMCVWVKTHTVNLSARYIPSRQNVLADQLSHHNHMISTEWLLLSHVFDEVCKVCGKLMIYFFVTGRIWKLLIWVWPVLDLMTWREDILLHPWDHLETDTVPPFAIIGWVEY